MVSFQKFLNKTTIACRFSYHSIENHDTIARLSIANAFVIFAKSISIKMLTDTVKFISFRIYLLSWTIEDFFRVINSAFAEYEDVYRILYLSKLPADSRKVDETNISIFISFYHLRHHNYLFADTVKTLAWKGDYINNCLILGSYASFI